MTFREEILADGVRLILGDCLAALPTLEAGSIDSVVTDPPYGLGFMGKDWDSPGGLGNFPMRRDHAMNMVNTGVTRQGGRQRSCEDFTKRQLKDARAFGEWCEAWACEVYRVLKPGGHLLAFGGTRTYHRLACAIEDAGFEIRDCIMWVYGSGFPKSRNVGNGWGTALKPACEPIVLARKPLISSVAENVLAHGTGAINVDGCRIGVNGGTVFAGHVDGLGRWPANIIHDGSAEVVEAFPESTSTGGQASLGAFRNGDVYGKGRDEREKRDPGFGDSGSAARFFYTAKADTDDRLGSKHPTVKPLDLMQYLVRLVTPKGGVVLDCFAGTGTTGEAAFRGRMRAVLIEREPEYQADIRRRMSLVLGGQDERRHAAIKASGKVEDDPGPLFKQEAML